MLANGRQQGLLLHAELSDSAAAPSTLFRVSGRRVKANLAKHALCWQFDGRSCLPRQHQSVNTGASVQLHAPQAHLLMVSGCCRCAGCWQPRTDDLLGLHAVLYDEILAVRHVEPQEQCSSFAACPCAPGCCGSDCSVSWELTGALSEHCTILSLQVRVRELQWHCCRCTAWRFTPSSGGRASRTSGGPPPSSSTPW
jgi:hypothetical protein